MASLAMLPVEYSVLVEDIKAVAALTDEVLQMIAGAGWTKIEIYYPTFLLSGNPNCSGMTPVIEKTENARLFIAIGIVVLVGISVVIVVVVNKKRKS